MSSFKLRVYVIGEDVVFVQITFVELAFGEVIVQSIPAVPVEILQVNESDPLLGVTR